MSKLKDLTGQRFGRLTVIERAENKGRRVRWKCKCDCGNTKIVTADSLLQANTQSCGCLHNEQIVERNFKHGKGHTTIYENWKAMKSRCLNPNNSKFKDYGGRGITIYPEWIHDFQAFYDYVSKLEHFGEKGYTLDRINNNGNYEPNNLRWADGKIQHRNKRTNVIVEYNGEKMILNDAAIKSGINRKTLSHRLKRGDTGERLFRPVKS